MTEAKEEVKTDTRVWMYGPNGQNQIFDHPEQVPEGWEDHPSKVKNTPPPSGGSVPHKVQGEPSGNQTQGGEIGQTTDSTFVLKAIDEVDKNWIIQHLNSRKVPHNTKWTKQKLYDLLRDAVSAR